MVVGAIVNGIADRHWQNGDAGCSGGVGMANLGYQLALGRIAQIDDEVINTLSVLQQRRRGVRCLRGDSH